MHPEPGVIFSALSHLNSDKAADKQDELYQQFIALLSRRDRVKFAV